MEDAEAVERDGGRRSPFGMSAATSRRETVETPGSKEPVKKQEKGNPQAEENRAADDHDECG